METKISYTVGGLILGILIGSLLGLAESNYTKKSLRSQTIPLLTIAGAIGGGLLGAYYGNKLGTRKFIEETTGIENSSTSFQKEGRYWSAVTTWKDSRDVSTTNTLETKRIGQGQIISFLNDFPILKHSTESASKESINKSHISIRQTVFDKIVDNFDEKSPSNLISLFESR